ncbi:MEC1 [[Candida] subhashii]|uniref:MEC1 n=1 Tax=[Candida] subhashii TaxID=561895 RepID=A0A8J5QAJ3_9ASCO|nr:MEC1 [[Candida] subhashii]KAG7661806.1 MEC1 [[Candida] subhashii]
MGSAFSLVIPVRSNLEVRVPSNNNVVHNRAFPKSASITFDGFDDSVNIFVSLQMSRQVIVRGSDSRASRLMLKRDDSRKDAKVAVFTTMVNRILRQSTEARKRNLYIPNYVVMPLAEDKGVNIGECVQA